jgi:hypothetical protein
MNMCEWDENGHFRVDPCMIDEIITINNIGSYKTILSCCGHGQYPRTIVVEEKTTGKVFEWYTGRELPARCRDRRKKRRHYYRRDPTGHFFLPF